MQKNIAQIKIHKRRFIKNPQKYINFNVIFSTDRFTQKEVLQVRNLKFRINLLENVVRRFAVCSYLTLRY